jgi:hypothetical protein
VRRCSLTVILGAFYVFLGATAVGFAGALGIIGGLVILALVATAAHTLPLVAHTLLLIAVGPFALLTWWSIVTPLLAILAIVIGSFALHRESRSGLHYEWAGQGSNLRPWD